MPTLKKELVKLKPVERKIIKKGEYKNPESKKGKPISFRIPIGLDDQLRKRQSLSGASMGEYLESVLDYYFKKNP